MFVLFAGAYVLEFIQEVDLSLGVLFFGTFESSQLWREIFETLEKE